MTSEVTPAVIGIIGAVLGSAVSGGLYYYVNKQRLKEETRQERAGVYLERKVDYLADLNEQIYAAMDSVISLHIATTELEVVQECLDSNQTRDELFEEKYKKYQEASEKSHECSAEFIRIYTKLSGFLDESDREIFHLAHRAHEDFIMRATYETSEKVDEVVYEGMRRKAREDIKEEFDRSLEDDELEGMTKYLTRRYNREAQKESEHFDQLVQGLERELPVSSGLEDEVDDREELSRMTIKAFEACLNIVHRELTEPIEELGD